MNREAFELAKTTFITEHLTIKEADYYEKAFGSWNITIAAEPDMRLVYDGKDNWLFVERKTDEIFNGIPVWSEVWIASNPTNADLLTGINTLIDQTR